MDQRQIYCAGPNHGIAGFNMPCEEVLIENSCEEALIEDCSGPFLVVEWQGPPGPAGAPGGGGSNPTFTAQNSTVSAILHGQAVALKNDGTIQLANASNTLKPCAGLAAADIAPTVSGDVQTEGLFTLSDWTSVIGAVNLAPNSMYYLDVVSGQITTVAPTTPGQIVQVIGRAVSVLVLDLQIEDYILL